MLDLSQYLRESKIDTLKSLIDSGAINDQNFNDIISYIKNGNRSVIDTLNRMVNPDTVRDFFSRHGIGERGWGRGETATSVFTRVFSKRNNLSKLAQIIKDNGAIDFDKIPDIGNIFDLPEIKDWKDEALTIAQLQNRGSSAKGDYELLLKFAIKMQNGNGKSGDVWCDGKEIEVKCVSKSDREKSNVSGAHLAGQKGSIRMAWSIYYILNKYAFGLTDDVIKKSDKSIYLQNMSKNGVGPIVEMWENITVPDGYNGSRGDFFTNILFDGLLYQYRVAEENDIAKSISSKGIETLGSGEIQQLRRNFVSYIGLSDMPPTQREYVRIIDAVGAAQMYLYSVVESFDNIIVLFLDKSNDSNPLNGKYLLVRRPEQLVDISSTLGILRFGPLDKATTTLGRTGKIFFR